MSDFDCGCPSLAHCLEATGGEQSLTAEEHELARLRRLLHAERDARRHAEFAAAQFERSAAFWEEQTRRYRQRLELAETSLHDAALQLARGCR